MIVFTDWFYKLLANAIKQHTASGNYDGPLSVCYVGLFTNNVTPQQGTLLGDLTEPAYAGYARQQCTPWSSEFIDGNQDHVIQGPILDFVMGDNALPTTVYGSFLADAATLVGKDALAERTIHWQ
jgi:hypothetical protein